MIDIDNETAIPVSPSLSTEPDLASAPKPARPVDQRTVILCGLTLGIAVAATIVARVLIALIGLVTNISFYGRFSTGFVSPAENRLGLWVVLVPALGGIIVGLMARYGSKAIRGHGIPEAMEQVLTNGSRIPPIITILKPLSAAIAIGTGGPFGAEGPIIATGGAFGSVLGQTLHITAAERKILLAAGASAGMTAIFGCPVAGVLLAIELLLFEFRARSIIPVAVACTVAAGLRTALVGPAPVFAMPAVANAPAGALVFYVALGALIGLCAVVVTRLVYAVEDAFERLPIHFMWWPALGGLVVGLIGYFAPHTLGVGYDNITHTLDGSFAGTALLFLVLMKLISWSVSLGSGTSGGTLAPLLTIGGGLGAFIGGLVAAAFPALGIDPRIAALVGMAGLFAGASRALLTSLVFAFETTQQPAGIVPLLGGCAASYLVSGLLLSNTIMTEKIVRRGIRVPSDYAADHLEQVSVGDAATEDVKALRADAILSDVRVFLASTDPHAPHQGFPVLNSDDSLLGVVTRRNLLDNTVPPESRIGDLIRRKPVTIYPDETLRAAADLMADTNIGRLIVVDRDSPTELRGILTRSDLLNAHRSRLTEARDASRHLNLFRKDE